MGHQRNALPGQRGGYRHLMQIVAPPLRRIIQRDPALFSIALPGVGILPSMNSRQRVQLADEIFFRE